MLGAPMLALAQPAGMIEVPLAQMLSDFGHMQFPQPRPTPVSPCQTDQRRLGCTSVSCLEMNFQALSPTCADFLRRPMPSPSPMPAIRLDIGEWTEVTPIRLGGVPPEIAMFLDMVPTELMSMMGFPPSPRPPMPSPEPQAPPSSHPCEREVQMCRDETHSTSREALQGCLVSHYAELSPTCKCFVHNVLGERAASPAPAVAPDVSVVVIEEPLPPPARAQMHHSMCMLISPLMFMCVAYLLARCCIKACIKTKPQFAAVVPPETVVIKTVEPLIAPKMVATVVAEPVTA